MAELTYTPMDTTTHLPSSIRSDWRLRLERLQRQWDLPVPLHSELPPNPLLHRVFQVPHKRLGGRLRCAQISQ
jgi:hypothetical protein